MGICLINRTTKPQEQLTAGTGINITNNVVSNVFTPLASPNLNNIDYNYLGYVENSTNYPSGTNAGGEFINVVRSTNPTVRLQIYMPYNVGIIYTRQLNGTTWTSWKGLHEIFGGTTEPATSLGVNGDVYIKY